MLPWDSQGAPAAAPELNGADPGALDAVLSLFLWNALLLLFCLSMSIMTGPGHCVLDDVLREAGIWNKCFVPQPE